MQRNQPGSAKKTGLRRNKAQQNQKLRSSWRNHPHEKSWEPELWQQRWFCGMQKNLGDIKEVQPTDLVPKECLG